HGLTRFTHARDFPRDRPRRDFDEGITIVDSVWELSDVDRAALRRLWPRAAAATHVSIARPYALIRRIGFIGLAPLESLRDEGRTAAAKVAKAVKSALKTLPEAAIAANAGVEALTEAVADKAWVSQPAKAVAA